MTVMYNSKLIAPGPLVDIRKEFVRSSAGKILRKNYVIQAKGKLHAWTGSPKSDGTFSSVSYHGHPETTSPPLIENIGADSRLAAFRSKMSAINDLFSTSGLWFEIQPFDGTQSIKFQPKVKNINFQQGLWAEYVDYVIDMEADTVYFGGAEADLGGTVEAEESWGIESADQIGRTYRLTHTISSQQNDTYASDGSIDKFGWQIARDIVLAHTGLTDTTQMYAAGVLDLSTRWQPYNYFNSETINEATGQVSVTETWLIYDPTQGGVTPGAPPALDDFTVNVRVGEDGIYHVTLEGTVTGLAGNNGATGDIPQSLDRWTAANNYFTTVILPTILTRASSYSGILLNPILLSSTVGRNPVQGTISYNFEYDNRIAPLIFGAVHEIIQVNNEGGTDVFASIPIPGRPWGPVLQGMDTITEKVLSINIDAQMLASNLFVGQLAPYTDGIILSFAPVAVQVFRSRDTSSWSYENGKYNRQVVFTYQ